MSTALNSRPLAPENKITVQELKEKLDRGDDFSLIDVREPNEYETARIEGAKLIPLATLPQNTGQLSSEKEIVVHCRSGGRSERAVQYLIDQGFTRARNLIGGIRAWSDEIDPGVPKY